MKAKEIAVAVLAVVGVATWGYLLDFGSVTEACARLVLHFVESEFGQDILQDRIAVSFFIAPMVVLATLIVVLLSLFGSLVPALLFIEYTTTAEERAEWREQDHRAAERYRAQRIQERLNSARNAQLHPPRRGPR